MRPTDAILMFRNKYGAEHIINNRQRLKKSIDKYRRKV